MRIFGSFREIGWLGALILIAIVAWQLDGFNTDTFTGFAIIVDGDSLEVSGERVRLSGIDAPEALQMCTRASGRWPCGREAERALERLIGGAVVSCDASGTDRFDRRLATCFSGDTNLNLEMVRRGWAVPNSAYFHEADLAKEQRLGIWQGEFQYPDEWRRDNPR